MGTIQLFWGRQEEENTDFKKCILLLLIILYFLQYYITPLYALEAERSSLQKNPNSNVFCLKVELIQSGNKCHCYCRMTIWPVHSNHFILAPLVELELVEFSLKPINQTRNPSQVSQLSTCSPESQKQHFCVGRLTRVFFPLCYSEAQLSIAYDSDLLCMDSPMYPKKKVNSSPFFIKYFQTQRDVLPLYLLNLSQAQNTFK